MQPSNVSQGLRPFLLLTGLIVGMTVSIAGPAVAEGPLANLIGDGKPWDMYVVKRKASNILVFRRDGGGTISDSIASITLTWWAVPGGICIKSQEETAEWCHQLTRTKEGIAASQNGKVVFILKR